MNKETVIVAAVACLVGAGVASLFVPKAPMTPEGSAFMITSFDHFAAPAGPSVMEVMHKRAKASLADFATTEAAAKLSLFADINQSAADAAIKSSASVCVTERAGVELPKFQQTMISEGVTMMVKTALAAGTPNPVNHDINAKAEAYMQEHAAEVIEEMQNAAVKQLTAGQTLMGEIASDPKLVMLCTAERAVEALAKG